MGNDDNHVVCMYERCGLDEGYDMDLNSTKQAIIDKIRQVYDPEISTNVFDLGLIYDINLSALPHVDIKMTLTSAWCPSAAELPLEVEQAATSVDGVTTCKVEIVWMPPWGPHMMSDEARLELNMWDDFPPSHGPWGLPWGSQDR